MEEEIKLKRHILNVSDNSDIVIEDLGFIKVRKQAKIELYTLEGVKIFIRKALI